MLTKVLIKRRFRSGYEKEIRSILTDLRYKAMAQPGYVSGITLVDPDNAQNMLVIGTWQSVDAWKRWQAHNDRKKFESMLEIYQHTPTEYEVYVVGEPFKSGPIAEDVT